MTRLEQMRERLASLSDEARSIRAQMPREFEPDVERIQQQMQRLGERLSELSGSFVYQTALPKPAVHFLRSLCRHLGPLGRALKVGSPAEGP